MTMDRRTFLGTMGAAYFALGRLHAATIPRVGVQLYTVRTLMERTSRGRSPALPASATRKSSSRGTSSARRIR